MQNWYKARSQRDLEAAIARGQTILERRPDHLTILRGNARMHEALGQPEKARPHWQKLLTENSADFEAATALAKTALAKGDSLEQALGQLSISDAPEFRENLIEVLKSSFDTGGLPDIHHVAICGVSFCGSTLLDRILGSLPETRGIGESHWLTKYYDGEKYVDFDLTQPEPKRMPRCAACRQHCEVLTYDFRLQLAAEPQQWYQKIAHRLAAKNLISADKNLPKLVDLDPFLNLDALILFKSPLQAWYSRFTKLPKDQPEDYYLEQIPTYLDKWVSTYRALWETFKPQGQKLLLPFEEFVKTPEKHLAFICHTLDLPHDPSVLQQIRIGHSIGGNSSAMARLREADYAVNIEQLPTPPIPNTHVQAVAEHEEAQTLHTTLMAAYQDQIHSFSK